MRYTFATSRPLSTANDCALRLALLTFFLLVCAIIYFAAFLTPLKFCSSLSLVSIPSPCQRVMRRVFLARLLLQAYLDRDFF